MFNADHIAISVTCLDKGRAFYADFLGGEIVSQPANKFLEVMLGDLRLHLVLEADAGTESAASGHCRSPRIDHLCLAVGNMSQLESLRDRLNGCRLLSAYGPFVIEDSPPLGIDPVTGQKTHAEQRPPRRVLYARDPDGIGLEFRCYN